jgi:hypothetical protein
MTWLSLNSAAKKLLYEARNAPDLGVLRNHRVHQSNWQSRLADSMLDQRLDLGSALIRRSAFDRSAHTRLRAAWGERGAGPLAVKMRQAEL